MTDRFTLGDALILHHPIYDNTKALNDKNTCNLLNEFDKENKRLYDNNIRITQIITEAFNNEEDEHTRNILKGIIEKI